MEAGGLSAAVHDETASDHGFIGSTAAPTEREVSVDREVACWR